MAPSVEGVVVDSVGHRARHQIHHAHPTTVVGDVCGGARGVDDDAPRCLADSDALPEGQVGLRVDGTDHSATADHGEDIHAEHGEVALFVYGTVSSGISIALLASDADAYPISVDVDFHAIDGGSREDQAPRLGAFVDIDLDLTPHRALTLVSLM